MTVTSDQMSPAQARTYQIGDMITELSLPAIDGSRFTLEWVQGKRYMISFMRFAACPFCQLRIHQLIGRWHELDDNFSVIAVFDSPLANLQKHAAKQAAPFPILADQHSRYYQQFAIKSSLTATLKGMLFKMPVLLYAMFVKCYFPSSIQGKMTILPADILVEEDGTIASIYRGKDSGDHLSFECVKAFAAQKQRL